MEAVSYPPDLSYDEVAEVVQDAWLSRASARRAARWLEARGLAYPGLRNPPADQSVRRRAGHRSVRAGIRRGRGRAMSAMLRNGVMR